MAITLTTSWQNIAKYEYVPGTGFKATFWLDARYTTQSIANNKSHIEVRLNSGVQAGSGSGKNYGFGASYCGTVSGSSLWTIENETITSGGGDVAHNADGSKTINISAWGYINGIGMSFNISADCILPKIPRYATCTQSSTAKTETSISMKWTSDSTCDYVWYSTNNGSSWTAIGSVNASSGTYSIPNLTANTSYNIKTRIRRKDSQLTTDSTALNISTYDYPKVSTAPVFKIGDNPTIGIYNPLGRSCKIYLIGNHNNQKEIGTTTTESISGLNTAAWKTWLYNSIPNTKSGTYRIRIVVSALSRDNNFTGNSYSIRDDGSELPNFSESDWSYVANLTSLTNNNQAVINGNSQITFTVNTQATSSFGATITGYIYKWGSKSSTNGSVSSGEGSILEVDAVDSRGLIKPTTKTLISGSTYIPYTKPTLDYSGSYTHRTDGISSEVRITLRGNLSVVKFGESGINNAVSDCKYRVYNYSTNTWTGPYDIPANNFTLNENGVYRLSNYLIHANGSSGGFTTGIRYGIEIILKDGNGLLSTLTTSLITITDGKIAKDVFQDGNGDYHQGINGLADEDYTEIIHGNEKINGNLSFAENNKASILWKEYGYGDKFRIIPNFNGFDDDNKLKIQGTVGGSGTDPTNFADLLTVSGLSGHVDISGATHSIKGFWSRPSGEVGTATSDSNSCLLIKRANNSEAPNNGVVLEYGNSANWRGQLYIGDNATQGIYYNGWSDGVRGSWRRLADAPVVLYNNSSGSIGTITLSESAGSFEYIEIFYGKSTGNGQGLASVKVPRPISAYANLICWSNLGSAPQLLTKIAYINGTSISHQSGYFINFGASNVNTGSSNEIKIYRVIGWR